MEIQIDYIDETERSFNFSAYGEKAQKILEGLI